MRGPDGADNQIESLLRAIFKVPALTAPKLGPPPAFAQDAGASVASAQPNKPARLSLIEFDGWELVSGVAMNEQHPATFSIPDVGQRSKVIPTDFVKLGFEVAEDEPDSEDGVTTFNERMWVQVKGSYGPYLWGTLSNEPSFEGADIGLEFGSEVVFLPEHILDIVDAEKQARDEAEFLALTSQMKDDE